MRVLHINTLYAGGAANACFRLHQALLNEGVESDVLVLNAKQQLAIPRVHIYQENKVWNKKLFLGNRIPRELQRRWKESQLTGIQYPKHKFNLSSAWYSLYKHPLVQQADIINLHWTNQFLDYQSFFQNVNKPIFWTLHDMTPFTGGCDYSFGCEHFLSACENCWFTQNARSSRWPEKILSQKKNALKNAQTNLQIIALSDWMKSNSERSSLFSGLPHHLIPNSLNIEIFKPSDKQEARKRLNLPEDKKIVLFISDSLEDKRKGFEYLQEALKLLNNPKILPVAIGRMSENTQSEDIKFLGFVSDNQILADAYNAADIFVIPSLEDNLPNTILEAHACGTPVIGFKKAGVAGMIPPFTGLLTEDTRADFLAHTIYYSLQKQNTFKQDVIREWAVQQYSPQIQAKRYLEQYHKAIK